MFREEQGGKLPRQRLLLAASTLFSLAYASHFLASLNAADIIGYASAVTAHEALTKRLIAASTFTPQVAVSDVVSKALAFEAMLSSTQQATLQLNYSTTLARKWSNLPCTDTCRNGIGLGTLTADQLAAALAVIQAVEGTATDQGFNQFQEIRMADDVLAAAQGSGTGGGPGGAGGGYGAGNYYLAFLNTPSTTGAWMMQFGGHHYAANISFNGGHIVSATPFFYGLEPLTFTVNGTTYTPLQQEHDAMAAMLASLSDSQLATAKLSQTFSDAVMIPGATNGGTDTFPTPKVGIPVSSLSDSQKQLVVAAMKPWVQDMDPTVAANLLAIYQTELDGTYIAYTGNGTPGSASSFLTANTNYARIDGPSVWIEFVCQNGVVFPNQIHYHTVWRDHNRDYAKDLSLTAPLDSSSTGGVSSVTATSAASYAVGSLAPEAIGTLFGSGLASTATAATTNPLPTTLGNVQVQITDISGTVRTAPLYYVSPTQISYQMPAGTTAGATTISVVLNGTTVGQGTTIVQAVTPGLFAANSNGQGVAAAYALLVKADGTQTIESLLQLNQTTNQYEAVPLSAATGTDQLFLIAFGTGFRNRSSLANVSATVGGLSAPVTFAGTQGAYVGLDQANIQIPSSLAGRGAVNVVLTADGQASNVVTINIK
jgi:uncharacterized protein (TIGR03437 family)